MSNINKFYEHLNSAGGKHVKVQTSWVNAKEIDWDNKTMTATGVRDGLDYQDVILGLGGVYIRPKVGTRCLIGLVENKDAAAYLIDASEIEEVDIDIDVKVSLKSQKIEFNGGEKHGLVLVEELTEKLNNIENDINSLKTAMTAWLPTASAGATLEPVAAALATSLATWSNQLLVKTLRPMIENVDIIQ